MRPKLLLFVGILFLVFREVDVQKKKQKKGRLITKKDYSQNVDARSNMDRKKEGREKEKGYPTMEEYTKVRTNKNKKTKDRQGTGSHRRQHSDKKKTDQTRNTAHKNKDRNNNKHSEKNKNKTHIKRQCKKNRLKGKKRNENNKAQHKECNTEIIDINMDERDINSELNDVLHNFTLIINQTLFQSSPESINPSVSESESDKRSTFSNNENQATSTGECSDTAPWCALYGDYCADFQQLRAFCPKTCDVCEKVSCADEINYCDYYVGLGYCAGTGYEAQAMKTYCYKSCSYCKEDSDGGNCGVVALRGNDSTLVVGGVNTKKGYYPWQVAILYNNDFLCGGSLISTTKVLTAAHCFNSIEVDSKEITVVLGEYNRALDEGTEQTIAVTSVVINDDYDEINVKNDIAILKLNSSPNFSEYVSTICLPDTENALGLESKCFLTGWGKMFASGESVNILQQVKMPVVDGSKCAEKNTFNSHVVTDQMICAGYEDGTSFASGCHGDSGGPLQCEVNGKWYLYGVVSWGSPLCNGLDRFTVFTRVRSYLKWIKEQ